MRSVRNSPLHIWSLTSIPKCLNYKTVKVDLYKNIPSICLYYAVLNRPNLCFWAIQSITKRVLLILSPCKDPILKMRSLSNLAHLFILFVSESFIAVIERHVYNVSEREFAFLPEWCCVWMWYMISFVFFLPTPNMISISFMPSFAN